MNIAIFLISYTARKANIQTFHGCLSLSAAELCLWVYHLAMRRRCRKSLIHPSNIIVHHRIRSHQLSRTPISFAYPLPHPKWKCFAPTSVTFLRFRSITQENVCALLISKRHEHVTKSHEIDRFRGIFSKPSRCRIGTSLRLGMSGKGYDRNRWIAMLFFPCSDFAAGVIAVLFGHLNVALREFQSPIIKMWRRDLPR